MTNQLGKLQPGDELIVRDPWGDLSGYINEEFLKAHVTDFSKHFYLCGPDKMIASLQQTLSSLGAEPDSVVFEK